MSSEINYLNTAFELTKDPSFSKYEEIEKKRHVDIRLFTGCPYLASNERYNNSSWSLYNKAGKPVKYYKAYEVERLKKRHQEYYVERNYSNAGLWVFIYGICMMLVLLFVPFFLLLDLLNWFSKDILFVTAMSDEAVFWMCIIGYPVSRIALYYLRQTQNLYGFTYERSTGKVYYAGPTGTNEYDFKDFKATYSIGVATGGAPTHDSYLTHKTKPIGYHMTTGSLTKGVLSWNYLVQFMDVSQPLPDIPEHEETRHLDPVTKAYDEKTGRDPFYWRKMTKKQIKAITDAEYEKAEAWVTERQNEIKQDWFKYSDEERNGWLNSLTQRHLI